MNGGVGGSRIGGEALRRGRNASEALKKILANVYSQAPGSFLIESV